MHVQVENHLSHASLTTRKIARILAVFLLSYATAYMETLTISHVGIVHVYLCWCLCYAVIAISSISIMPSRMQDILCWDQQIMDMTALSALLSIAS